MTKSFATLLLVLCTATGCRTPSILSRYPFSDSVAGFSYAATGALTYRVMYVGRWGASPQAVQKALQHRTHQLCGGSYALEELEERITIVSHTDTEGGVSVRALAKCGSLPPNNSSKPTPLRGAA